MLQRVRALLTLAGMVLLVTVQPAPASVILNTLQNPQPGEPGLSGRVDGLFSGSGGNTERILLEVGASVQWQGGQDRVWVKLSGGYQESRKVETGRNVVAHLRHNRAWTDAWSSVAFAQVQHNPFQRLHDRWLLGVGPRYDFVQAPAGVAALGATPMLEVERLEGESGHVARGRLSVFLHLGRRLSASTRLDATAFWQPLFSDFSASRAVGNLTLTVDVSGAVDLKVGAAVEDNARAPAGVKRTDWSTFTGLGVGF